MSKLPNISTILLALAFSLFLNSVSAEERCLFGSCSSKANFFILDKSDRLELGYSTDLLTVYKNSTWRCRSLDYGVGRSYRRACLNLEGKLQVNVHTIIEGSYYRHGEGIVFSPNGSVAYEGLWEDGEFSKSQKTQFSKNDSTRYVLDYSHYLSEYFPNCLRGSCRSGFSVGWINKYQIAWGTWSRGSPISLEKSFVFENLKEKLESENPWLAASTGTGSNAQVTLNCLRGDCENGYGVAEIGATGKYWGFFEGGSPNGAGKLENKDEIYVGDFVDGLYEGQGKLVVEKSDYTYEGDFYGGYRHGRGVAQYGSGDLYKGEFYEGKKDGFGELIWANGNRYEGQWSSGARVDGVWVSSEGEIYEGEYKDELRHGKGKLTYRNGRSQEGFFEKGELIEVTGSGTSSNEWVSEDAMKAPWEKD